MELVAGGGVKISLLGCNMRVDKLYLALCLQAQVGI